MARGGKREGAGRPEGAVNKVAADVKAAAQEYGAAAITKLAQMAGLVEGIAAAQSESAQVVAVNSILDRAYGKPRQSVDVDASVNATITEIRRTIVRPRHTDA